MADEEQQDEQQEETPVEPETSEAAEAPVEPEASAETPPEPDPEAPPEEPGPPVPEPESPEPTPEPAPPAEPVAQDEAVVGDQEAEEVAEAAPAEAPKEVRRKRKRLPRSQRRVRPKPKREQTGERKAIIRLPKPEHERGRRQERRGVVVSAAMDKTIVVRVDTVKSHPRYKKVVRQSQKFHAHDEQNQAKAGDVVRIVEMRPLSKTKNWRLAEVVEAAK
jgi:small subunit ribosomal protein S17